RGEGSLAEIVDTTLTGSVSGATSSFRRKQPAFRQIGLDRRTPQYRCKRNAVPAATLGRHVFVEAALAAGGAVRREVRAAVTERIEWIVLAVEPQRRLAVGGAAREQRAVDETRGRTTGAEPAADEVDRGLRLVGPPPAPGDREDAAARLAADHES